MARALRPAASVGVRDLKDHVSSVLRRVRRGETVTVTDRKRAVAILVPVSPENAAETARRLVAAGRLSWAGGIPRGCRRPPVARGASVSSAVVEDRR